MLRNRILFLSILVYLSTINSLAQVYDKVVALDGSGTSYSISSALSRATSGTADNPFIVYIKNGVYNEKIQTSLKFISLIGESVDGVIITNGDYNGDGTHGTSDSYTLWADGDNFYAENITIQNSAGNVGQAVALKTDGSHQVFKNCKLLGFQDTYYAHSGMQYLQNCFIEGATDFIFGDATTVFDNCTVNCVNGGQYITAPADSKLTSIRSDGTTMIHGLLFMNSLIKSGSGVSDNSYYLGRPWQPRSSSVYMNCTLGKHIKPIGWSTWSDDNHLSSYFAEYKNLDSEGTLVDTINRADWSYQISDSYASDYYNLDYFLTKEGTSWNPIPETEVLDAPTGLSGEMYSLTWNSVSDAIGYVIIRNDSTIGFSETANYKDESAISSIANVYTVKSVTTNGNLSLSSGKYSVAISAINSIDELGNKLNIFVSDRVLKTNIPVEIMLYNLSGKLVLYDINNQAINLSKLSSGMYFVSVKDKSGNAFTKKILLK